MGILIIAFVFFNTFVMSDSGWVDENNNIYSHVDGMVGIGTDSPAEKLHITGHLIIDKEGDHPKLYGCISTQDMNLYLKLLNSPNYTSAMGLKAGGILVSDSYSYADPGKNDLVVKGNVGIGTNSPNEKVTINTDDTTANYPTATSRGDIDLRIKTQNQGIEFGTDGETNTRKSWILARHSSISTYGKFYSSLHLQPDVGDKTVYKGVAIGYSAGTTVPVGTHLMVNGNVGIGTKEPDEKLTVNGKIHAKEIIVDNNIYADFVFEDDYRLASLSEVEEFIEKEGHLPEIPSAAEVEEKGVSLGAMNTKLLQKIEEVTLYIIEQDKRIAELEKKLSGIE